MDAGTSISVKPQVADGDQIVMEYTVSLSTFSGAAASPTLPPPRQENKLTSIVTVPEFAIVLGGLQVETEGEAESRVPWLADIPLLGALFKDRSVTKTRARFYVFLRCSVMRDELFADLKYVSREASDSVGVDDGFPVLEPRVIR
jgi:general secretion pathway protein D